MDKHEELARKGGFIKSGNEGKTTTSREYSHDDGQHSGMFLGGLGTPVFSRDFDGSFSRWHLEAGIHVQHRMEEAFLLFTWKGKHKNTLHESAIVLNANAIEQGFKREVTALFPCMWETYSHLELPFKIKLHSYSPIITHDTKTSSLPLVFFDLSIECDESMEEEWEFSFSLFFPNLLGWRAGYITPVDRTLTPFPSQSHAGNTAFGVESSSKDNVLAVCQTRNTPYSKDAKRSLEGEVMLFASADKESKLSREICYKAGQNRIGRADEEQEHTIAWAKAKCIQEHKLPMSELTWEAHWDEAIGSALAATMKIKANEKRNVTFAMAIDCPITEFGKGRTWYTKYTEYFGTSGHNSKKLMEYALEHHQEWKEKIYLWHKKYVDESSLPVDIALTQINELYFLLGGGTAFVREQVDKNSTMPRLGDKEHFGLLEGFDVGYHYYNTTDLWVYSFAALSRHFPEICDGVFDDVLETIPLTMPTEHMIYREAEMKPFLVYGKIPHDHGSAPSDPWHDLNGYQMRDDSNQWLDHVPCVLVSYYLHCAKTQKKPNVEQWHKIKEGFSFLLSQQGEDALPHHKAFGDSTWDNLGLKGLCTYTSTAVIAAYHVVKAWAKEFDEVDIQEKAQQQLEKAYKGFEEHLWTGEYYRACTEGSYENCIMADSLMWLMYLNMAGLEHQVPIENIKKHLDAAYRYSYKKHGYHGPLLICEPERGSFPPDGGDIGLQVNEVLLGSAWTSVALMEHYDLKEEAREIARDMADYQYKKSGLHFRSPAAWDSLDRFRAPLNMRPLAISLIGW